MDAVAAATAAVAVLPQALSPSPTPPAVGVAPRTSPSPAIGVDNGGGGGGGPGGGGGGGGDGDGGDVGGGGDAEDGTCRTSSAYILLQLRDLGRKPSSPDVDKSKETVAATTVTAAANSPVTTAQQRFASDNGAQQQQLRQQQQQHRQQQQIQRQQHQQRQLQQHQQQVQDERAAAGVNGGGGSGGVPYGVSSTTNTPASGYGITAAALERGMYVAGLLPGFQGGTSPVPSAVAPSQGSLLQQLPPQMPRGAVLPPGMGGSAALRPICPKRSPDTVMVISPTTGQLVPVSRLVELRDMGLYDMIWLWYGSAYSMARRVPGHC